MQMPENSQWRVGNLLSKCEHDLVEAVPIRAVILDYGEVVSVPPSSEQMGLMAAVLGMNPDLFRTLYPTDRAPYDRGDLSSATYWSKFANDAHVSLDLTRIEELRRLDVEMWSRVNPQMIRWIECLSDAGLKTALLSNMIPDMAVHARQKFSWLNKLTYQVLSCEVKLVKPDRAIYERCLEGLRVTPQEALFVDDSETNVQAARAVGITSIRFQSVGQLQDELAVLPLAILPSLSEQRFSNVSVKD
jgi:putative hydrolase of the HAD superfamily